MTFSFVKRAALIIALSVLILWGAKTAHFALTDGFSLAKISSEHVDNPELEIAALTDPEAAEVNRVLSQEFTYLAKGHHAYVFESADKQYVIKFFQFQKYRYHPLINWFPLPAVLDEKRQAKIVHKEQKRNAFLKSWKIAFTKLKDQTQLKFVHLNRAEPIGKTLTLHNKCGMTYHIDLDQYVFMLQKKVDLFDDVLEKFVSNGNMPEAKKLLDNLLNLYRSEHRQGLFEEDRHIVRNTGVVDHQPMHLDIDRFREDARLLEPEQQYFQLQWKTVHLVKWLEDRYPELAEHLKYNLKNESKV